MLLSNMRQDGSMNADGAHAQNPAFEEKDMKLV